MGMWATNFQVGGVRREMTANDWLVMPFDEKHDLAPLLAAGRNAGGITNCIAERVADELVAGLARQGAELDGLHLALRPQAGELGQDLAAGEDEHHQR